MLHTHTKKDEYFHVHYVLTVLKTFLHIPRFDSLLYHPQLSLPNLFFLTNEFYKNSDEIFFTIK